MNLQQITFHPEREKYWRNFLFTSSWHVSCNFSLKFQHKEKGKIRFPVESERENLLSTHKKLGDSVRSESMYLLPKIYRNKIFLTIFKSPFLKFLHRFHLSATPLDLLPSFSLSHSLDKVVILVYRFSSHNGEENIFGRENRAFISTLWEFIEILSTLSFMIIIMRLFLLHFIK